MLLRVQPPPSTIAEVVERLRALERPKDGVGCFAQLYRTVTEGVAADLGARTFADPTFLERLDVRFAGLFLESVESPTSAWRPLFDARSRRGITPLQFAVAGMNAHINFDLPVALVATCEELGLELRDGSPEQADYEQVNVLLGHVEQQIRHLYLPGWVATLDRIVHPFRHIEDVVAMWNVARARDAAWLNGQALWAIRGEPKLSADFLGTLGSMVGLASRGLLVPADTWVKRLGRLLTRR